MKHWCLVAMACLSVPTFQVYAKNNCNQPKSISKTEFINKVIKEIKQEVDGRNGVFRVIKEYTFSGKEPLETTTKIDFCGYRKRPESLKKRLKKGVPTQKIEVIYKTNDSSCLSLVTRDVSGNNLPRTEKIDISSVTCA